MGKRIILASASPRRRELMKLICPDYECITSDCDESFSEKLTPENVVKELSRRKAGAVAYNVKDDAVVIGADTIVSLDGKILGKPASGHEALSMLRRLSGRMHRVYTGLAFYVVESGKCTLLENYYVVSDVHFDELGDEEIEEYIASGEPMDKAGAYGIQGLGAKFVRSIDGDYFNVVGLPVNSVYKTLKRNGVL